MKSFPVLFSPPTLAKVAFSVSAENSAFVSGKFRQNKETQKWKKKKRQAMKLIAKYKVRRVISDVGFDVNHFSMLFEEFYCEILDFFGNYKVIASSAQIVLENYR